MIYALSVFASAVLISLTAAYFSVVGLATMFPGSQASVIVMGLVLELGKLMSAVWLHQNWNKMGRIIRYYLLGAVLVLIGITSMGIFGYLSQAHIEHESIVGQERSKLEEIDQKVARLNDNIERQQRQILKIESSAVEKTQNNSAIIKTLQDRILQINTETAASIKTEEGVITTLDSGLSALDAARGIILEKGGFGTSSKLKVLAEEQLEERKKVKDSRSRALERIQSHREQAADQIAITRNKVDALQAQESPAEGSSGSGEEYYVLIEESHDKISTLKLERIGYEKKLKLIEAEVGPVKYIAAMIEDVGGSSLPVDKMIRVVIIALIFVFDPLAITLLIAATISINHYKKDSLPPDVLAIRNKLLDEIEEYIANGGLAEHFIERARNQGASIRVQPSGKGSPPSAPSSTPAKKKPPPTPTSSAQSVGVSWPNKVC